MITGGVIQTITHLPAAISVRSRGTFWKRVEECWVRCRLMRVLENIKVTAPLFPVLKHSLLTLFTVASHEASAACAMTGDMITVCAVLTLACQHTILTVETQGTACRTQGIVT